MLALAQDTGPKVTDWLTAVGGLLVFAATALLAFLAYKQMGKLHAQAQAAQDQVKAARDQVEVMRQASASEAAAMREQIDASVGLSKTIRDAARTQLQPRVLVRDMGGARGPNEELQLTEGDIAFGYFLTNEGGGIATNIRHGIEIGGEDYAYGGGQEVRVLGPGQSAPPLALDSGTDQLVPRRPFAVVKRDDELPLRWQTMPVTHWASFENAFGERYETRNPLDPSKSATFTQVSDR